MQPMHRREGQAMRKTSLADEYERWGGRAVDFHGWLLPLQFSGIIEEHLHVRKKVGIFDCSHMGEFMLRGEKAIAAVDALVIGDLISLKSGKCRYTALLNEHGGIIDDCVALRLSQDEMLLVTNAGPLEQVDALLHHHAPDVINISEETSKIDVQGPLAPQVLHSLGFEEAAHLAFWNGQRTSWNGCEVVIARAGYTGELGYELYVPNELAVPLWRSLAELPEVMPCGLGSRDTLRTEMGYPLSGQDVDETRTPLEAGMDRFIAWDTNFPGKARLVEQRESGEYLVLTLFSSPDRRAPRHGFALCRDGQTVGEMTSGAYGPSLAHGVGLGYAPVSMVQPGAVFEAGPRGLQVTVEALPAYKLATGKNPIGSLNRQHGGEHVL